MITDHRYMGKCLNVYIAGVYTSVLNIREHIIICSHVYNVYIIDKLLYGLYICEYDNYW